MDYRDPIITGLLAASQQDPVRNALGIAHGGVLNDTYGVGYQNPLVTNDSQDYDTRNVLAQMPDEGGLSGGMRWLSGALKRGAEAKSPTLPVANPIGNPFVNALLGMGAGGLDTMANWLDWKPKVGRDTLAPLGLLGMSLASGAAKRMPHPTTEWPTHAAVRIGEKTFTGTSHLDAITKAQAALGEDILVRGAGSVATDGFLTNAGRYVSREEAGRMLDALNQTRHYKTWLGNDKKGKANLLSEALELYDPMTGRLLADNARASAPGVVANALDQIGASRRIPDPIKAYHGSPHDFDAFDISKIGTGEGAQAYGHGLYFAEKEGVAESYKYARGRPDGRGMADEFLGWARGDTEKALGAIRKKRDEGFYRRERGQEADLAIKLLESGYKSPGRLYEVSIHAKPEQFLDWDKPLSGQHPALRKSIDPALDAIRRSDADIGYPTKPDMSVSEFFRSHKTQHDNPDLASKAIADAGIVGIRYLDQGSRGMRVGPSSPANDIARQWLERAGGDQKQAMAMLEAHLRGTSQDIGSNQVMSALRDMRPPTNNYVVFDPAIIEILRKYGILAPVAGSALASGLNKLGSDQQ